MARVLFHIDLNAFFASAEELRHPELKGKPLGIGGNSSRGVLSTCNYIARQAGLHSAMPVLQAKEMCPELVLLPPDGEYYRKLSGQFFALIRQYCPRMEILSIDECFVDATDVITKYPRPLDLAVAIQRAVYEKLGLKCSIGVAPTRFLAKMASDLRKPMGLSVIRKRDIPAKLYPLDVETCIGIGTKTVPKLQEAGIATIGDLADPENEALCAQIFKNSWPEMKARIHGQSSDQLVFSSSRKSISHSRTFLSDLYSLEDLQSQCRTLVYELAESMKKKNQRGAQVSLVLRDIHFRNKVRSKKLSGYTNDPIILYEAVSGLLQKEFDPVGYRHIGVTVGSLANEEQMLFQPTLFDFDAGAPDHLLESLNRSLSKEETGGKLMTLGDLMRKKEEEKSSDKADAKSPKANPANPDEEKTAAPAASENAYA